MTLLGSPARTVPPTSDDSRAQLRRQTCPLSPPPWGSPGQTKEADHDKSSTDETNPQIPTSPRASTGRSARAGCSKDGIRIATRRIHQLTGICDPVHSSVWRLRRRLRSSPEGNDDSRSGLRRGRKHGKQRFRDDPRGQGRIRGINYRRDPHHRHIARFTINRQGVFAVGREEHVARILAHMNGQRIRFAFRYPEWSGRRFRCW